MLAAGRRPYRGGPRISRPRDRSRRTWGFPSCSCSAACCLQQSIGAGGQGLSPWPPAPKKPSSDGANLLGLRALLALRDLELDALVLVEAAESAGGDRRVV